MVSLSYFFTIYKTMKTRKEKLEYLKNFVSDEKNELFARMINERTDYIAIVLEDLYQSHNQSAVMRSADCFGVQQLHIIENRNKYDFTSTVSRGGRNWLSITRHNQTSFNTPQAIKELKEAGYRIVATTPHTNDVDLPEFDLNKGPAAFVFGTEWTGISDSVMEMADEYVKIPMTGFTESLNVSVCAAILMYDLTQRLRSSTINWKLSDERKEEVLFQWYSHAVKASDEILERFEQSDR